MPQHSVQDVREGQKMCTVNFFVRFDKERGSGVDVMIPPSQLPEFDNLKRIILQFRKNVLFCLVYEICASILKSKIRDTFDGGLL